MQFTIQRSKWLRGKSNSVLRNLQEEMCCLGFFSLACGLKPRQILYKTMPFHVETNIINKLAPNNLFHAMIQGNSISNSHLADALMEINDRENCPESEREKLLTDVFQKHGITVTFID